MGRTFRYGDEDDEQILGPGDRLVVPMALMDSMDQRTAAVEEVKRSTYRAGEHLGLHNRPDVRITDGAGDSGLALHRPGFRISSTITRDRSIYDAYDAELARSYKNVGGVESEVCGQRDGDSCTVKSDKGGDASADSKLNDAVRDEREAAHQEYQDRIQNAWKDGR